MSGSLTGKLLISSMGSTSAAFIPADNTLLFVRVGASASGDSSLMGTDLTLSDSLGLTWEQVLVSTLHPGWGYGDSVWITHIGHGESMTVTAGAGAFGIHAYHLGIWEYSNYDVERPIGATALGSDADGNGPASITLNVEPRTTSEVQKFLNNTFNSGADPTPPVDGGPGWEKITTQWDSSWGTYDTEVRRNSSSTDISWDDLIIPAGNTSVGGILSAIEIRANEVADKPIGPAIIRRPWTKKPPVGALLDRAKSGAHGLVFASIYNGNPSQIANLTDAFYARDLVSGAIPLGVAASGTTQLRYATGTSAHPILQGVCHFQDPTAGESGYQYGELDQWKPNALTIVCAANHLDATEQNSGPRIVSYSTGGGDRYGIFVNNGTTRARINDVSFDIADDLSPDNCVSFALSNDPDNGVDGIDFRLRNHTTGTALQRTTSAGVTMNYATGTGLFVGHNGPASARSFSGEIYYVYIFNRVLSQTIVESLWANPWQIFKPRTIYIGKPDSLKQRLVVW